jgi:hypothetical protein
MIRLVLATVLALAPVVASASIIDRALASIPGPYAMVLFSEGSLEWLPDGFDSMEACEATLAEFRASFEAAMRDPRMVILNPPRMDLECIQK